MSDLVGSGGSKETCWDRSFIDNQKHAEWHSKKRTCTARKSGWISNSNQNAKYLPDFFGLLHRTYRKINHNRREKLTIAVWILYWQQKTYRMTHTKKNLAVQESPIEYQTITKTRNIYQKSLDCFIGPTATSITTDEKDLPSLLECLPQVSDDCLQNYCFSCLPCTSNCKGHRYNQ